MFDQFPKTRPALPREIAEIHSTQYRLNREGRTVASSLSQKMEAWMHKQVAKDVSGEPGLKTTLEIGAGTLNQFSYEPNVGPYDIVEPFKDFYADSSLLGRIRNVYSDVSEIPAVMRYHRITSVAAFEHICHLPEVIAKSGLLLEPSGVLRVAIPSEGTPLWTLGWKLTTGLEYHIKHGLDYGLMMKHEHVNTAKEIEELVRYFFRDVEFRLFGISRYFSLYQFYACKNPRPERCNQWIG